MSTPLGLGFGTEQYCQCRSLKLLMRSLLRLGLTRHNGVPYGMRPSLSRWAYDYCGFDQGFGRASW